MKWSGWYGGAAVVLAASWLFARAPSPAMPPERPSLVKHPPADAPPAALRLQTRQPPGGPELPQRMRDPFTFSRPDLPPAPASKAPAVPLPAMPPLPLGAPAPGQDLRLLGIAAQSSAFGVQRTAILTDDSGELYLALEGELVAGRYAIRLIGPEGVEFTDRNGDSTHVLSLWPDGAGARDDGALQDETS
nr:hypothetical protein [Acidobacteriota bacterium]